MHIKEKINFDMQQLIAHGPITIVALGDSVTHGAVGAGEIDYETVYWNRLKRRINDLRPYVPVNVINAGIGGITAKYSLGRLDSQVLKHEPDLVIVCFGLNDVNGPKEEFLSSLATIFERCTGSGADVIFMTPNMLNTSVHPDTEKQYFEYAHKTAQMQNEGRMDAYMNEAVALARSMGIPVADCYSRWKALSKERDITSLLANYINHPTREMHELFAEELFRVIFGNDTEGEDAESTMWKE